ncbi:Mitogen-activated protein kinase kinase kinase 4 [Aphelenchoides besseyi]|nr:Mitogen-activated protein kinase kinase kinase 4 [Aphelenchoides besseyi]KAI6207650.1 Mitogen-activated protein kinase kinase kinase 4 [Aphelenchoides besseyi]
MKRSNSSQELVGAKNKKTRTSQRYVGRYSFPKLQSHSRKKMKPRQSPRRLSEYIEEFEEQDSFHVYKCLGPSPDGESSSHDRSLSPPTPSGILDVLRMELNAFSKRTMITDSMNVGRTRSEDGGVGAKFGNFLWLNLQALFANRAMDPNNIQRSLQTQNSILLKKQKEMSQILETIEDFRCSPYTLESTDWIKLVYSRDFIQNLSENRQKIEEMLGKYEALRELFPNYKAMSLQLNISSGVCTRILLLNCWLNTLNDLIMKIKLYGEYFEILEDRRKRSLIDRRRSGSSSSGSLPRFYWPTFLIEDEEMTVDEEKEHIDISMDDMADKFASLYVTVVSKSLRLRGITEILGKLKRIGGVTTDKACLYFLLRRRYADVAGDSKINTLVQRLHHLHEPKDNIRNQHFEDACKHTYHTSVTKEMQLPNFYPIFLFFIRVEVDLVHQWLRMRSEKVSSQELDYQTLQTFIEDSHDILNAAIKIKSNYILIIQATSQNPEEHLAYLEGFDSNLDLVFRNYLAYVRTWANTVSVKNDLEWTEKLINTLNKEYKVAKNTASSVSQGETTASKLFCTIAFDFVSNIKNFLNDGIDIIDKLSLETQNSSEDEFELIDDMGTVSSILILCRALKEMNRNLRDRSLKSLHFLRTLCLDLEFSAKYKCSEEDDDASDLVHLLLENNHTILRPTNLEDCPFLIMGNHRNNDITNRLLSTTFAINDLKDHTRHSDVQAHYIVLIPVTLVPNDILDMTGQSAVDLNVNARFSLNHTITTNGVYLISNNRTALEKSRELFEWTVSSMIDEGRLIITEDAVCCNEQLAESLHSVKEEAFLIGKEIWSHAEELNDYVLNGKNVEQLNQAERDSLNATLLQAFNTAFEFYKELARTISYSKRREFYATVVKCVDGWADFVCRSITQVRRSIPNFVMAPLNYLLSLDRNSFEVFLDENQESFASSVRKCIFHLDDVAKTATIRDSASQTKPINLPLFNQLGALNLERYIVERKSSVRDRIRESIKEMEKNRDVTLRSQRTIGKIVDTPDRYNFIERLYSKPAPFQWQRLENKLLGRGSFGSVYLVINKRDNCLMAMKSIKVQREDNDSLKALADEVEIFRNLDHPNLVKYYGVSVENESLLIFMEYCNQGTLARVCREGLDLVCVRQYTYYLLEAVSYLHAHKIIHRDIKPANIFLGRKQVLKLGDFGCSFRITNSTFSGTRLIDFCGTTRYTAPELHTKGGNIAESQPGVYRGYGRAVDIWSVGCVILEMLTGKVPYHNFENDLQIIFRIGMGCLPNIPVEIEKNEVANSFLHECFKVNPDERPDARTLLQHRFANVLPHIPEDSQEANANR